jgi:hypothetical protein
MIVRLVNPTYDVRRRRVAKNPGGEGGYMAHKHSYKRRRRNPFAPGDINKLAVKVAGALGGAVAAATVPNMLSPAMATGWAGVAMALAIAFGGGFMLKSMSPDLSEGVLIGGSVQAVSRAITIVTGKTLLTASRGQYGPLQFPIPTPAYSQQAAPAIAASASKTSGKAAAATPQAVAAAMSGRRQGYSKFVS